MLQHPQAVKYPISNDCLKVDIDCHSITHLVTKLLLKVFVQEHHNIIVGTPEEGDLKEAINADKNIIIIESMLQNNFPTQPNKISEKCEVMYGCESCISAKSMNSYL